MKIIFKLEYPKTFTDSKSVFDLKVVKYHMADKKIIKGINSIIKVGTKFKESKKSIYYNSVNNNCETVESSLIA